jgi:hypothetical protein
MAVSDLIVVIETVIDRYGVAWCRVTLKGTVPNDFDWVQV